MILQVTTGESALTLSSRGAEHELLLDVHTLSMLLAAALLAALLAYVFSGNFLVTCHRRLLFIG